MKLKKSLLHSTIIAFVFLFCASQTTVKAETSELFNQSVEKITDRIIENTAKQGDSVIDESISNQLVGADLTKLIVVPSPTGETCKEYASTAVGLKQALYELYLNGVGNDYAIYVGISIAALAGADANVAPTTPSAENATFKMLEGKVGNLVITGTSSDEITNSTVVPTGAKNLGFTAKSYMGTNVILRNMSYTGTALYMNGHNLSLNGGSRGNGLIVYGGAETEDVSGNPVITVNATGTGIWDFYGGNATSGTLTGNPTVVINNTTAGVRTVSAGGNAGIVNGNATLEINGASGLISNVYAGGNTAQLTGSIKTIIHDKNAATTMRLLNIYGATFGGKVEGTVSTTIRGYGGWNSTTSLFVGGSERGDSGTDRTIDGITSDVDTSLFTTGVAEFLGGNRISGTIKGNIISTINAGTNNKGSFYTVSGAGGFNINKLNQTTIGASNQDTYDAMTPTQRAEIAEKNATFKVYGNIELNLKGGVVSNDSDRGYTRGAGYGGYIEGNTSVTTGTLNPDGKTGGVGYVRSALADTNVTNWDYISSPRVGSDSTLRTYTQNYWDIVGGGGSPGEGWTIYIKGNTKVTHNNTLARWTYGGGFSGVIEGNTEITLNHGLVDTLEGGGYDTKRIYGDTKATMNNGEVNFFFSGGGWDDDLIVGNASAVAYGGVVNCAIGGSYGASTGHKIIGNADVKVFGGDFSGYPSHGTPGFSGGLTNAGEITGNASLTLDLRGSSGFKMPSDTKISGGRNFSTSGLTKLGTDDTNTITLNIFTDPGEDILNGADIYGDGGTTSANTKSGNIFINIDAPDSVIGNLYATQYSNISSSKLLRKVEMNIQRAGSLSALSGGSSADNVTNIIAENSLSATPKKSIDINFGVDAIGVGGDIVSQKAPIQVTKTGINNFTDMLITNQTQVYSSGGNIRNGFNATAANHNSTYNKFGNILLEENSGLGVSTTTNYISAGKLTIHGESSLESSQGTGIVNISDIEFVDEKNDRLTWIKNNTLATPKVKAKGTWFGDQDAFQVLTINPTVANASKLTPFNFMGREKETGKTFLGDNDVTGAASGYGVMIPGSVIDYEVGVPKIDGKGFLEHNVESVLENNTPTPLKTWGTEVAGKKVQKGRLIIPEGAGILPTISMTPETIDTGSWLYGAKIATTKVGTAVEEIPEQTNSNAMDWTSKDGSYSYTLVANYSNKAELSARNIILTESQAATIKTEAEINALVEVEGRPFLNSSITPTLIAEVNSALNEEQYQRTTNVTYTVGTAAQNPANELKQTINIIVVKDSSIVSADKHYAIYAKDVSIMVTDAQKLVSQEKFESDFTKVLVISSDGSARAATSDAGYFDNIKGTQTTDAPKDIPVKYSFDTGEEVINKDIVVYITPSIADLTVRFVNELNEELHAPVIRKDELIGSKINLLTETNVLAAIANVESKHYEVSERPSNEDEVVIVVDGTSVTYKFVGTLFIASAPKTIDFGTVIYDATVKQVDDASRNEDLIVNDTRASKSKWILGAKVKTQMTNDTDSTVKLIDSLQYYYDTDKIVLNDGLQVIYQEASNSQTTMKVTNISDSWGTTKQSDGIKLVVDPSISKVTKGTYSGVIEWQFMEATP